MINAISGTLPETKKTDENKHTISNEEIFKKLLELEARIRKIEEKLLKPLIG